MSQFDFINKRKENIQEDTKIYIKKSFDIIERLHELLEEKKITQKELAIRLGKSESEVSKWINGVQNFTIKTLSKLEAAIGEEVIHVPCKRNISTIQNVQIRSNQLMPSLIFHSFNIDDEKHFKSLKVHYYGGSEVKNQPNLDICQSLIMYNCENIQRKLDKSQDIQSAQWFRLDGICEGEQIDEEVKLRNESNIGV